MKNIRHASGKAPHVATIKDREAVTHPGVMVVALFDTPSVSTWSVEAVQNPRRLCVVYYPIGVKYTDPIMAAMPVQVLEINLVLFGSSSQIKQTLSCCMGTYYTVYMLHFP